MQKQSTNILQKNKGITIVEVIVTIFILVVGIVGAFGALRQPVGMTNHSINTLKAFYFAQEGIEIVRNERDRMYLEEEPWDVNILGIRTTDLTVNPIPGTAFRRQVFLNGVDDKIEVKVKISWTEKNEEYEVDVQENLYNWL